MTLERSSAHGTTALAQLLAGRERPHKRFTLEVVRDGARHTMELAVRAISTHEQQQARADALRYLATTCGWQREDLVTDLGEGVLNLEVMVQILTRALVDPESPSQAAAKDAEAVRKLLDVDEIQACFDQHVAFQEERSPFHRVKTLAEVEEMVAALGKGQLSPSRLMRCERTTLIDIITALAAKVSTPTTPKSSDTSPLIESPEVSSAPSASPTEMPILFGSGT